MSDDYWESFEGKSIKPLDLENFIRLCRFDCVLKDGVKVTITLEDYFNIICSYKKPLYECSLEEYEKLKLIHAL